MADEPARDENGRSVRPREAPPGFVAVEDGEGRLLFFYDPARDLVQIKPRGGIVVLIDLRMYRERREPQGKVI